jgi:hypothetical protein
MWNYQRRVPLDYNFTRLVYRLDNSFRSLGLFLTLTYFYVMANILVRAVDNKCNFVLFDCATRILQQQITRETAILKIFALILGIEIENERLVFKRLEEKRIVNTITCNCLGNWVLLSIESFRSCVFPCKSRILVQTWYWVRLLRLCYKVWSSITRRNL